MIIPKIKAYYTYQELLDAITLEDVALPRYPNDSEMSDSWYTSLIGAGDLQIDSYPLSADFTDALLTAIVNYLMSIVYDRHAYDYIAWIEPSGNDGDDMSDAIYQALVKLINVINLTMPKYVPLLVQNKKYSIDPVAPIGSSTIGRTKFNDTPQNEGEFNDEEHASNVSESSSETKVDSGSIVQRLDELFKNYRSVILEWSNEFNRLFLKEEQL